MQKTLPALPVDSILPAIASALKGHSSLVLEAAPGAGKTTRVPPALLGQVAGDVLVLEPRRLAARLAARRAAMEAGEALGETVGYQVRFEEVAGPRTRLRFVTEGVLTRRLLSDPDLRGVDAVVLDEFHERHLDTDLALALLRRLQQRRPQLKLVVMSATLDAVPVAAFLGGCPVFKAEGRAFPLTLEYRPYSPKPLEEQVRGALDLLLQSRHSGHILVFLPGAAEIRRAARACEGLASAAGALLLPLHGDLSPAEQDRAVAPSVQQKVLLSTNVAESSVTIDGVTAVIDSGLARVAAFSPWSSLPMLEVRRISKASATQRAGRAGRTGPGRVVRLYPQEDFAQRPDHDTPEILRSDLSGLTLALRAMGIPHVSDLAWLDAPPEAAAAHAEQLLARLEGAAAGVSAMARLPLPPRLARTVLEAQARGVLEGGIAVASLLAAGTRVGPGDLLSALDLPPEGRMEQQRQQLRRLLRGSRQEHRDEDALLLSVLTGFPDRVARLRAGRQLLLANGLSAELAGEPPPYELMVVLDAEDRRDRQAPLVRMTARVEPEWLLDLFPERIHEDVSVEWNRAAERVDAVSTLRYDELVLEESRNGRPDAEAAAALLAAKALENGVENLVDATALQELLARLHFAGLAEPDLPAEVRRMCDGLRSFAELRALCKGLLPGLEAAAGSRLRELAPATLRLPNGRSTPIHYETGKPPWVASRLQDFFGMRQTPRLGPQQLPVVAHLLAPNRRPVQTTSDLPGFWERLYPQVRRELMRRYPRHSWPEKP